MNYNTKMVISVAWDLIDFLFRIPVLGTATDVVGGFLSIYLWGVGRGSWAFLEVVDVTDQLDAFIPTLTLIGLSVGRVKQ